MVWQVAAGILIAVLVLIPAVFGLNVMDDARYGEGGFAGGAIAISAALCAGVIYMAFR